MKASQDWEKLVRRMELLMRLKSFPIAFKLLNKKEMLSDIPFLRRTDHKVTLCQLITLVRTFGWTMGADVDDFIFPMCPSVIGLTDLPEVYKDGTFRSIAWTKTREDGRKYENSVPRLPVGDYEAVALGPLVHNPFDPDIVLIYANPAQMMLLINALQFDDYEVMEFFCVGETSCSDAIARCYLRGKPSLTIPCFGERRYGHAQDDELVMAIPGGIMEKALQGMEALYKRGIRYPISHAGAELDATHVFPKSYSGMKQLEEIRGKDNRILLGVTGGIATGKTVVAHMLEQLGAKMIDFDILSRTVMEPGRPAWKDIIAYFGEQVLREDRTLDRKKLSEIVFPDKEKRRKLEEFTHSRILEEFIGRVKAYSTKGPNAVIEAVVPLLFEVNLQYLFHKTLVVYTSEAIQIERLIMRDQISRERATLIIQSQMSIEEKRGYADFVVDNSGSLEEARKQVEEVWKKLKKIQEEHLPPM